MNTPTVGFRKAGEMVTAPVRNDSGATITLGSPVTLDLAGTEDGLRVFLPSDGGSQALSDMFFYGVALTDIPDGTIGDVQLFGVCQKVILRRATRSEASTGVNWVGSTSIAKGVLLSLDTVNDIFSTAAGSATVGETTVTYVNSRRPFAFLAQDVASFASTDSVATSNGTALTVYAKAFVRVL